MIDKVLSPGRSLLCNPFAQQQTRLVMVLFDNLYPPHKVIKTLPLFFFPDCLVLDYCSVYTPLLCLNGTMLGENQCRRATSLQGEHT